jgi:hypothetical protein
MGSCHTYKHPICAYLITLCFSTDFSICRFQDFSIEIPRNSKIGEKKHTNCLVLALLHKALKTGRIVRCIQELLANNFLDVQFFNFFNGLPNFLPDAFLRSC